MTHDDLNQAATASLEDRVRDAIKGVLEQVMEEEMDAQLQAKHRERTERRLGERNGHYGRGLTTTAGHIEQIRVPRSREMPFLTEVFERYRRMTGSLEEAVLEMYWRWDIAHPGRLDAQSRGDHGQALGHAHLEGRREPHRGPLRGRVHRMADTAARPRAGIPVPLSGCDVPRPAEAGGKARWAGAVRDVALLVAVGVSDEGFREVLAVEVAVGERTESYRSLLQGLNERGLRGVKLVISDDHDPARLGGAGIKSAVKVELPSAAWQRCTVHLQRNVLAHVPQTESKAVAADLKVIFQAGRRETAEALAAAFSERYEKLYPKAVASLGRGLDEALTPPRRGGRDTAFPSSHHRLIRTTNGLERTFREVERRTRVVDVFPTEQSAATLATAVLLRVSEDWSERRYLDMAPLHALFS